MTVLLMLLLFSVCITIDYVKKMKRAVPKGTTYVTPGYEFLGALAQDGGKRIEKK